MTEPPRAVNRYSAATPTERFSPALADLLATVRDFLKDADTHSEGGFKYQSQVARYLLDMSLRELDAGVSLDRHSAARIAALLGGDQEAADPVAALCRSIRAGCFDDRWGEALRVLLEETAERAAIIRPGVLAPEHATRFPIKGGKT